VDLFLPKYMQLFYSFSRKFTINHVPKTCLSKELEELLMNFSGLNDLGIFFIQECYQNTKQCRFPGVFSQTVRQDVKMEPGHFTPCT